MIHWTWIVFSAVVILLLVWASRDRGGMDFTGLFAIICLIVFVLIGGGIFWW